MQIEISQEAINGLAQLAYANWAEAYDQLKLVKAETDDGSADWSAFHSARLTSGRQRCENAKLILDAIGKHSTLAKNSRA